MTIMRKFWIRQDDAANCQSLTLVQMIFFCAAMFIDMDENYSASFSKIFLIGRRNVTDECDSALIVRLF